jgi:hypothetical protein
MRDKLRSAQSRAAPSLYLRARAHPRRRFMREAGCAGASVCLCAVRRMTVARALRFGREAAFERLLLSSVWPVGGRRFGEGESFLEAPPRGDQVRPLDALNGPGNLVLDREAARPQVGLPSCRGATSGLHRREVGHPVGSERLALARPSLCLCLGDLLLLLHLGDHPLDELGRLPTLRLRWAAL